MSRVEFMTKLASLLQDVPVEERREAMQYYNDYFDDAGAENEQQVIKELESPEKVAAKLKEDLGMGGLHDASPESEQKKESVKSDKKIWIIILAVLALPVIIPIVAGLISTVFGIVVAAFGVFIALVIASVAVAFSGIAILFVGIFKLMSEFVAGLGLVGVGLILGTLGVMATVGSVQLCVYVVPKIWKGIVWIWQKAVQFGRRKAVV